MVFQYSFKSSISDIKSIILVLIIISFGQKLTAGGPWTQAKAQGYFKLSQWWIIFDEHYTDQGQLDPNVTTGIFNTYFYAEYGLSDRLTGLFNGPLFSRNYMNNLRSLTTNELIVKGEAVNSLGDIDIGLKYGLTKPGSQFPVAATVILGLPTGKSVAGTLENLQTGDGEFNQLIQIDAGTGFQLGERANGYISAFLGFNNRTKGFSEEFRFGLEYGAGLFNQRLWFIGRLFGIESLKNGDTAASTNSTSIFANNTEFISISMEVNYYFTKQIGLSVSMAGALRGEIIAAAPTYSVGVFLDLSRQ